MTFADLIGVVCPGAGLSADGTCPNCGRRTKRVGAGVEHVRGRVSGKPYAPLPVRKLKCPDCDAELQTVKGLTRCPWSTSRRAIFDAGIVRCGWPKGRPTADWHVRPEMNP